MPRYCGVCGARQDRDGVCGSLKVASILVNGVPLERFSHVFDTEGSIGYCEDCGRNSISCECHDYDLWPDAMHWSPEQEGAE